MDTIKMVNVLLFMILVVLWVIAFILRQIGKNK